MQKKLFDDDLYSIQQARALSESAKSAYNIFSTFSQEQVDKIIDSMTKVGIENSERLARLAVEETGCGNVKDKIVKNIFATKNVYDSIKNLKTVGVINRYYDNKIIEIAHPMGVICAITPVTNPTSTAMFKALVSVKARNAVVFAPHPKAIECSKEAALLMSEAAEKAGAPKGLISCMSLVTLEGTKALMSSPNISIILATGGTEMIKAAHSYGKPAIGVGPGNAPAYIDKSADLEKAARDIMSSKTFDNGVICSSEQAIIVHKDIHSEFKKIIESLGGYFLSQTETEKISSILISGSAMNPDMVGKSIEILTNAANISVPATSKLLIAQLTGVGQEYPLSREVLAPVIAYYTEKDWEEACKRCIDILNFGGRGHTMAIHAYDEEVVTAFAHQKPVFRILINTPTSQGAIGFTTSLNPSMTLSTGTWGGGISTDNISAKNLINIKRVAYETNPINPGSAAYTGTDNITEDKIKREDIESIVRRVLEKMAPEIR